MTTETNVGGHDTHFAPAARISLTRPFLWLRDGWDDLLYNPGASLAYGLLVSVLGALILSFWRHPFMIAASISAFLLVGPLLTTGLCELSRLRAQGERGNFDSSLTALTRNRSAMTRFTGELLVLSVAWFALSALTLSLTPGDVGPSVRDTIWGGALEQVTSAQTLSYVVVGGILACVVFARSVVSVPLIIDRQTDAKTAVRTSLRVTLAHLPTMLLWAGLIVVLVGLGFATFLIGMVVVFPLLGHATWHAYEDLVRSSD